VELVMRYGDKVIDAANEVETSYDRSELIKKAIESVDFNRGSICDLLFH
jgi:hypothetical protein